MAGLVIGKPGGIVFATWLSSRRWLGGVETPIPWPSLAGAATLAGVGFTVSLLIADISFGGQTLEDAKIGILGASILAAALSAVVFRAVSYLPQRTAGLPGTRPAPPPADISDPIDPDVDHLRGSSDASVTLLEYGDFDCPDCGRAESIIRDLTRLTGDDLRFVFRHLPLVDVHDHAQQAAEAAGAAAAQGKFWEMHDLLFSRQDALERDALFELARTLGLDMDRFTRDMADRRHALRVARDVESADLDDVAGTPTFFINGRRHHGSYDLDALLVAVRGGPRRGRRGT